MNLLRLKLERGPGNAFIGAAHGTGMERTESHLEDSLQELNDRVNALEDGGDPEQLLEAYVNRGSVLAMLEFRTSALDDLESAAELASALESEGRAVDAGTFVKIHVTAGALLFDQEVDPVEEYLLAATRLDGLVPGSRHFDHRSIVRMCISVSENLIDSEHPEDCMDYVAKGLSELRGSDPWTENRRMELRGLAAEAYNDMGRTEEAIAEYEGAVSIGTGLMSRGALEDPDELVMALVMKADCESELGRYEDGIGSLTAAVSILEGMMENHMEYDREAIVSLHHDLAGVLMKVGRTEEAEKHLIRAMEIGVAGYVGSIDQDRGRRRPTSYIRSWHTRGHERRGDHPRHRGPGSAGCRRRRGLRGDAGPHRQVHLRGHIRGEVHREPGPSRPGHRPVGGRCL